MLLCPRCRGVVEKFDLRCPACDIDLVARPPIAVEEDPSHEAHDTPVRAASVVSSPSAPAYVPASELPGQVCQSCQAFNESGLRRCTNCGELLDASSDHMERVSASTPTLEQSLHAERAEAQDVEAPASWGEAPSGDRTPAEASPAYEAPPYEVSAEETPRAEADRTPAEAVPSPLLSRDATPPDGSAPLPDFQPPEPEAARDEAHELATAPAFAHYAEAGGTTAEGIVSLDDNEAALASSPLIRAIAEIEAPGETAPSGDTPREGVEPLPAEQASDLGGATPLSDDDYNQASEPELPAVDGFSAAVAEEVAPPPAAEPFAADAAPSPESEPEFVEEPPEPEARIEAVTADSTPLLAAQLRSSLAPAPAVLEEKTCSSCGFANPRAARFCASCGTPLAQAAAAVLLGNVPPPPANVKPLPAPVLQKRRLAVLRGTPSAGADLLVTEPAASLGREQGEVVLGDDPYLGPLHATFTLEGDGRLAVRDEGSLNGVFVRIGAQPVPLVPGDLFFVGERFFRYSGPEEQLPVETEPEPEPLHGSPRPSGALHTLVEIVAGGRTGRTCRRVGPTVLFGRTGCDVNFPNDASLSAKHAEVAFDGAQTLLRDLGSESGTFLRLHPRAEHVLEFGDTVRVGQQILRVEAE